MDLIEARQRLISNWQALAEGGDPDAQRVYGQELCRGIACERDFDAGRKWIARASERGDLVAKDLLTYMQSRSGTVIDLAPFFVGDNQRYWVTWARDAKRIDESVASTLPTPPPITSQLATIAKLKKENESLRDLSRNVEAMLQKRLEEKLGEYMSIIQKIESRHAAAEALTNQEFDAELLRIKRDHARVEAKTKREFEIRLSRVKSLHTAELQKTEHVSKEHLARTERGYEEKIAVMDRGYEERITDMERGYAERIAGMERTFKTRFDEVGRKCEQLSVELQRAERKVQVPEAQTSSECVICMDAQRTHICLPCGHFVMCDSCISLVADCPICRTRVQSFVKVFL